MRLKNSVSGLVTVIAVSFVMAASQPANAQPANAPDSRDQAQPATPADNSAAADSPAAANGDAAAADSDSKADGAAPASTNDVPVQLRIRSLEQRVQALKERAWRAKARVGMLKEQVLGGGVGARAGITHINDMGSKFRLIKLVYALDGQVVFSQESTELYKKRAVEITSGPITPGSHTLSVVAKYRGHGYGVFRYMRKNTYTVKDSHTFTVEEGKALSLKAIAFETGGFGTQLRDRPKMKFKISIAASNKPKPSKISK